jgi:hypothetical protein
MEIYTRDFLMLAGQTGGSSAGFEYYVDSFGLLDVQLGPVPQHLAHHI